MLKYEDNLWGKVDFLHNRYHKIYSNLKHFLEMITKFQLAFQNFSKSINFISNKNYKIYSDNKLSLYPVIGSIPKNISLHSKEFAEFSEFIHSKIIEQGSKSLNEAYTKENNLYQNYINSKKTYNNSKIDLEKSKNVFNNNAKLCENLIINAKSMKYNALVSKKDIEKNENLANEGLSDVKNYENRYIQYLKETNKNREETNKKESDLLKMYQEMDKELMIKIKGMICMYVAGIKKMYSTILNDITWINNQFKNINSENDTNLFINKYKSNIQKEEKIPFIPYEPKSTLNPNLIESSGNSQKDENMLDINYEVISFLKNNLKNVCSSINLEEEGKKKRLRYLTSKVFKVNVDFLDEEKKELLEMIKNVTYRKYFLVMLSKQRTKGRYKRGKKLIEDLSEILNNIIDYSEKEKDYEGAKNCIILSQTYYYEITKKDRKQYKYYLFNNIKKHQWLNATEFWDNLIEVMIQKEIKANEESNAKNKISEKYKKNALSNIGFGQLLPYSQNMLEIGIPKENIKLICQKYIDKYGVKKDFADVILNNINNLKMRFEGEYIEDEDNKINQKRKNSLPNDKNEKESFDDNIPNSMYNKSNLNLLNNDEDNLIDNINTDSNPNKINFINDEKDEEDKKDINILNINDNKNIKDNDNKQKKEDEEKINNINNEK